MCPLLEGDNIGRYSKVYLIDYSNHYRFYFPYILEGAQSCNEPMRTLVFLQHPHNKLSVICHEHSIMGMDAFQGHVLLILLTYGKTMSTM